MWRRDGPISAYKSTKETNCTKAISPMDVGAAGHLQNRRSLKETSCQEEANLSYS